MGTVRPAGSATSNWPYAAGEVAQRVATHDWAATALGPRALWPPRIACMTEIALADPRPTAVTIGTDPASQTITIANDALAALVGSPDVPATEPTMRALGLPGALEMARNKGMVAFARVAATNWSARARHVPLRDDEGAVIGIVSNFERADQPGDVLPIDDSRHRVRNMLAIVRSVARRTREKATTFATYLERFDGRLDAIARVQAMLAARPEGLELWELASEEALTQGLREGEGMALNGPDVLLTPRAAEVLGLALHELIANAIEHGGAGDDGTAKIEWRSEPDRSLRIEWYAGGEGANNSTGTLVRQGAGSSAASPRTGFGREVIDAMLPYELDARTELSVDGMAVRCRIDVPGEHVSWIAR